jgi:uncharacterized protein
MSERPKSVRPSPRVDLIARPFWEAVGGGKLMLQYDPEAKRYQFWPRGLSLQTGKTNLQWREVSGKGKLYSFTVTHVPMPGFEERVPYPLGLIDLAEGVRIIANLVKVRPEQAKIGLPVRFTTEALPDGGRLFAFEPDE